ncbi:hypothetical protein IFO69_14330 [Echinicola sp. CAU 1574]|uniref:Uncharacterized protein n=1 Tax=Echinicola arenosa TaxID=2774144 RepID=A0ABR9AMA1_9BACT|nr:hypothetical protein [Echinicola arenosa]MBD8489930.1 hypothetical protein [Echinicola arenosa]
MNLAQHCKLCDYSQYDIEKGFFCGITQSKPDFKKKCAEIKFDEKYKQLIRDINIEHHLVKSSKALTIGNLIVFLLIAIAFLAAGFWYGTMAWDKGIVATVPFIIGGIGFLVLPLATGPVYKYKRDMAVAREKKERLDRLLGVYNISYEIEITVRKDLHGNKEFDTKLEFTRKHYR